MKTGEAVSREASWNPAQPCSAAPGCEMAPKSVAAVQVGRRNPIRLPAEDDVCPGEIEKLGPREGSRRRDPAIRPRGPSGNHGFSSWPAIRSAASFPDRTPFRLPRLLHGQQAFPKRTGGANG